jgi:hypothetical protein
VRLFDGPACEKINIHVEFDKKIYTICLLPVHHLNTMVVLID